MVGAGRCGEVGEPAPYHDCSIPGIDREYFEVKDRAPRGSVFFGEDELEVDGE